MITVSVKKLIEAIEEAEAFSLPDMTEGTRYLYHDSVGVGMLMTNKGPGVNDSVPPDKVYLYEGWVTPVEVKEGT